MDLDSKQMERMPDPDCPVTVNKNQEVSNCPVISYAIESVLKVKIKVVMIFIMSFISNIHSFR